MRQDYFKKARDKLLLICLAVFLGLSIFVFGLEIVNGKKIVRGVKTADINLGGLKIERAEEILESSLNRFEENGLIIKYQNQTWPIKFKELGLEIEKDETLKKAFKIGRQKNILDGLSQQIRALFGQYNLPIIFRIDQSRFSYLIKNQLGAVEKPVKNVNLVYDPIKDKFNLIPGQNGFLIDQGKFEKDISQRVGSLSLTPIELSLIEKKPEVVEEEAEKTRRKVLAILENGPYYIKNQEQSWPIDKKMLIDWLYFIPQENVLTIVLNQEKIKDYLMDLSPIVSRPAINAWLTAEEDNKIAVAVPEQNKIELNIQKSAGLISEMILNQGTGGLITSKQKEIQLAIDISPAEVRSQNISQLGLAAFLGLGVSNFSDSPNNRVHNIKIGAAKFNGLLLKPNEEFSFNAILGEIGAKEGYLPELVIKNNKTVPEYGGGLCQVSTTLFRAAVNAGLKITERYPHSFPVRYYSPQGFDATIYPPHPDLRFINDTSNNILIQSRVKDSQLIFEVFGQNDNRETKVIGPFVYEKKEDGSMKAILTQEVYQNGDLLRKKVFYSNYKSPAFYPVERNPLE